MSFRGAAAVGLRAVEPLLRDGIFRVAQQPYEGVNVELRRDLPEDFAVFSNVDIAGTDPNRQGLFGYDNTPGKDVMNLRLHDRIGGVNASTQADGFPGYGGVFIESFMAFSTDPGGRLPVACMIPPRNTGVQVTIASARSMSFGSTI